MDLSTPIGLSSIGHRETVPFTFEEARNYDDFYISALAALVFIFYLISSIKSRD